ncbi:MAG: hypothetical protein SFW67_36245 [Myxococcaceae bacterium]|nr:hypothetical protein [Myxococcaceae bacterium]
MSTLTFARISSRDSAALVAPRSMAKANPGSAKLARARRLLAKGDRTGARRLVRALGDSSPTRSTFEVWEACAGGDHALLLEATSARLKALQVEPEEDLAWWLDRLLMFEPPDLECVALILARMQALYPASPLANFVQARVHARRGEVQAACEALSRVVALQPQANAAWLEREVSEFREFDGLTRGEAFRGLLRSIAQVR